MQLDNMGEFQAIPWASRKLGTLVGDGFHCLGNEALQNLPGRKTLRVLQQSQASGHLR